ncbi:MAG: YidC/Oxa1 family membrane protein insertase, partial [Patescibacteria group bacterium]
VLYAPFLKIITIDPGFLGFNLALSPQKAGLGYYYLIPVITAVLQYYQAQTMQPSAAKALDGKPTKESKDKKAEKTSSGEDFQKAMNMQMKYIFPLFIGWFAFSLPVGLSLYWNIFSIFSIIQYRNSKS